MGGYRLESCPNKNDGQMVFITFECASVDDIVQGEICVTCWGHLGATHMDKHYKCSRWKFKKNITNRTHRFDPSSRKPLANQMVMFRPSNLCQNGFTPTMTRSMQWGCPFRAVQARIHGHLTSDKNDPEISTEKTYEPPKHWVFFMKNLDLAIKKFAFSYHQLGSKI